MHSFFHSNTRNVPLLDHYLLIQYEICMYSQQCYITIQEIWTRARIETNLSTYRDNYKVNIRIFNYIITVYRCFHLAESLKISTFSCSLKRKHLFKNLTIYKSLSATSKAMFDNITLFRSLKDIVLNIYFSALITFYYPSLYYILVVFT